MSKKPEISPEILENILVKVTERLAETFKLFIDQLVSAVTSRVDHVQSKMDDLNTVVSSRIDDLKRKLMLPTTATSSIETGSMDQTLKTLMAVETEKTEKTEREPKCRAM